RRRPHQGADLGRSDGDPQHPSHRGGVGLGTVFDGDRKYPVRESEDRKDHRAFRDRMPAEAACALAHWHLTASAKAARLAQNQRENRHGRRDAEGTRYIRYAFSSGPAPEDGVAEDAFSWLR